MARLSVWSLLILSGAFASGCKNSEPPNPLTAVVATAHGDELTLGEISAEMPAPLTGMDSASWCQRFIADWQQRRTLVHLAKTELPESERDFHREITQYTEALFIHAYEDRYLRDNLDTALSTSELQSFLDEQPELFKLDAPVFRARWLVFPANEPFPRDIRDWHVNSLPRTPKFCPTCRAVAPMRAWTTTSKPSNGGLGQSFQNASPWTPDARPDNKRATGSPKSNGRPIPQPVVLMMNAPCCWSLSA